jgi:hypothetical protein
MEANLLQRYEVAYDNYNFFVVSYGSTERPSPKAFQEMNSPPEKQAPHILELFWRRKLGLSGQPITRVAYDLSQLRGRSN